MSQIKAIQTEYKGYKFRSRLEARWAVFFDAAGIKWEYEPQGFECEDGTRYLPDFYLPEYDWYAEVKAPRSGAVEEVEKACKFLGSKIKVLVILGNIPPKSDADLYHYRAFYKNPLTDAIIMGSVCINLGLTADSDPYTYLAFSTRLGVDWDRHIPVLYNFKNVKEDIFIAVHDRNLYSGDKPGGTFSYCDATIHDDDGGRDFINGCYDKARQARFEYGESPD